MLGRGVDIAIRLPAPNYETPRWTRVAAQPGEDKGRRWSERLFRFVFLSWLLPSPLKKTNNSYLLAFNRSRFSTQWQDRVVVRTYWPRRCPFKRCCAVSFTKTTDSQSSSTKKTHQARGFLWQNNNPKKKNKTEAGQRRWQADDWGVCNSPRAPVALWGGPLHPPASSASCGTSQIDVRGIKMRRISSRGG